MSNGHRTRTILTALLALCVAGALLSGCDKAADKTTAVTGAGKTDTAASGPGPSMLASAAFTDPFDGSVGVPGSISAAVVAESNYEGQWGPASKPNPTASEAGGALTIGSVSEYKGYDPSMLNASQGTFEMLYTPVADFESVMTFANRPEWQKFSTYDPPPNGFLLDTIGWRAAPTASYGITYGFAESTATVGWGIWDGSVWHTITYSESSDAPRPMRITASYGPAGVLLFVDGKKVAEDTTYTGGIDTAQPLTIGQAPWYWPYGPHSAPGTVQEFKYDATQVTGG